MIRVSVAMATYNGAKYIGEQLDSILCQLGDEDEVVISDDGSLDDTLDIIASYNDERIKLYHAGYQNFIKNFSNALSKCSGKFVFLCDQDDVWEADKLETMLPSLKHNLLVVSNCKVVDKDLQTIHPSFFELRNSGPGFMKNLWKNSFLGCCMGFRRELLQVALPIPENILTHDTWLGLIAELYGNTFFIEDCLLQYRRHGVNESSTSEKSSNGLFKMFKIRFDIVINLIARKLQANKSLNSDNQL